MAEQVNQRIEDFINELEQMRRTSLYSDDELKQITRRRKEYEYQIQRHMKRKEDFVHYISYEIALLEDISNRRKKANVTEKKKDIEYAIANRLNRVFKQFIYRFQNEVEVYFEYLKFCKGVGFNSAASAIIGQMLQMHGDKPKMWMLASKWEAEEQGNIEASKSFLLKGLQRHEDSEELYLELFKQELLVLVFSTEIEEEKENVLKRADIVWRNGMKNVDDVGFLFKCLDLILKYGVEGDMKKCIMAEIWARNDKKKVWHYIAVKELEDCHWEVIEEFVESDNKYPKGLRNCIGVFEEALTKFPDEDLCTKYIHTLLGLNESICEDWLKISALKQAWMTGYKGELLTNDMFTFGFEMLKMEGETSDEELWKLLNNVTEKQTKLRSVWIEKLLLSKPDENKMMNLLEDAIKVLKEEDAVHLYKVLVDNIISNDALHKLLKKVKNCDNTIILQIKPQLLNKMYKNNGLKAARDLYEELIKTPPIQLEVITQMISIESLEEKPNVKQIRKLYEFAIVYHGTSDTDIWNDYIEFEIITGDAVIAPPIYSRAIDMLDSKLIPDFIKKQTMHQINKYPSQQTILKMS